MKNLIKKILKEETLKDTIKQMIGDGGIKSVIDYFGGIENLANTVSDGDIKEFFKEFNIEPYVIIDSIAHNGSVPNMYINENFVDYLDLKEGPTGELILGTFRWGPVKLNSPDRIYCLLNKNWIKKINGINYYKVTGIGGDKGFGYSYILKRNILGKKYRDQIFKQIIDKYNLDFK